VIVGCKVNPAHGWWKALPSNLYAGRGCKKCAVEAHIATIGERLRKTTDEFIAAAIAVHGTEKYKYDVTLYEHSMRKVTIFCITCDDTFEQTARTHLDGKGCPECGRIARAEAMLLEQEEVIRRFTAMHRDRYDYSRFEYQDYKTKSWIGCREPNHGFFKMHANAHLEGKGCPKCSQSTGETKVRHWLDDHGIAYEVEFRVGHREGVQPKGLGLRFDFRLLSYPILIEYDGEGHFIPIRWAGTSRAEDVLKKVKVRDEYKDTWAAQNGYNLIRIRFDEDVGEALTQRLLPLL
jgi:protein-arginine kinase activator protein McsA